MTNSEIFKEYSRLRQKNFDITLDDMRRSLGDHPSVRFMEQEVDGCKMVIVCYMVSDPSLWKLDYALEARGITFDAVTGKCICRPFEKFFRLNENEMVSESFVAEEYSRAIFAGAERFPFGSTEVLEKMDGSMVTPVFIKGKIYFKSKKSFYSDVALAANAAAGDQLRKWCELMLELNLQPIFEFSSPNHRIVIDYGTVPRFTLIATRWIHTGAYPPVSGFGNLLKNDAELTNVGVVEQHEARFTSFESLKAYIDTAENTEGVVIRFPFMQVKMKTKWYDDRHHILDLRERDVADAVVGEFLDDIMAQMIEAGKDVSRVRSIEETVIAQLNSIRSMISAHCKECEGMEMRFVAAKLEGNPLRGLVIAQLKGRDVDVVKYWKDWFRKDFSLTSITNENF